MNVPPRRSAGSSTVPLYDCMILQSNRNHIHFYIQIDLVLGYFVFACVVIQ